MIIFLLYDFINGHSRNPTSNPSEPNIKFPPSSKMTMTTINLSFPSHHYIIKSMTFMGEY